MRVLHVAESTAGGLGTYLEAVTRAGSARGHDVHVAAPETETVAARFPVQVARFHRWNARAQPGLHVAVEMRALRRILARVGPDVVHLHSSKAGLVGRLLIRGRRPTVMQPHSWSFMAVDGVWAAGALRWERAAGRWTDLVLCVSESERQAAAVAGVGAHCVVVPNGVDLTRFAAADAAARSAARQRLGIGPQPLAVCVGRLHRQKNQQALLDAWPVVRASVTDARLALVGDGPDAGALESRAVAGVDLVGAVEDPRDWYAAADLVVQPSRWEGMSLAVLEALATSRSVVATQVAGMTEILEPAALVPPDDAAALVAAVVGRLRDPASAAAEGARGRARVESSHDLRRHLREVLDLEESVVGRRTAP